MIGVTPVGILTSQPEASQKFYHEVMGVDRVQQVKRMDQDVSGDPNVLMKLESPCLEVFAIETRLMDRQSNRVIRRDYSLLLHPKDTHSLLEKLASENIECQVSEKGKMVFEDLNGITWEIRPEKAFLA